jgi:hypothetical protein
MRADPCWHEKLLRHMPGLVAFSDIVPSSISETVKTTGDDDSAQGMKALVGVPVGYDNTSKNPLFFSSTRGTVHAPD